jgi:F-box-like
MECLDSCENSIEKLPTELLINIFKYIPDRWSISLVSRLFYEVVCKIEQNIYEISIQDKNLVKKRFFV